jgi:hypothetical protein
MVVEMMLHSVSVPAYKGSVSDLQASVEEIAHALSPTFTYSNNHAQCTPFVALQN